MLTLLLCTRALAAPDLSALATLHSTVADAANAWLAGSSTGVIRVEAGPETRTALQLAGVDRLELLAMELEVGADGGAVRVRTQSRTASRGPVLVDFRVDDVPMHGVARTAWTETVVGAAADALTAAVSGDGCAALPLAQLADLPVFFSAKPGTAEVIARQAAAAPAACALARGVVMGQVRVDDVAFLGYARGTAVRIVIAELGLREGILMMEVGGVQALE